MIEAFPLSWPSGFGRTQNRVKSRFEQTMDKAQKYLHKEVERIDGKDLVVSTNIPVRNDGMLYANWMSKKIEDPGVAIYFKRNKKHICLCCDKYAYIWENVYALGRSLEAMRQIERDGVSDFIERAFTGFPALPSSVITPYKKDWWIVLGFNEKPINPSLVEAAYKLAAKKTHPDTGGSVEAFQELNIAMQEAKKHFS